MVQMMLTSSTCNVPNRAQTSVARPSRSSVRVHAQMPAREQQFDLRTMTAGIAAAALVFTGSAQAGVILEQPEVKKVFQADKSSAPAAKSSSAAAPAPKAPKAKKAESSSEGGLSLDPRTVALPLSLAGIAGGAFALAKIDPGFVQVFNTTVIKDSNIDGAGYEAVLKNGAIPARGAAKKGTTKIGTGLFGKK